MNNLTVNFNGRPIPESHIHVKFKGERKCIVTCDELPHYAIKAVKDGTSDSVFRTKKSTLLLAKCPDQEKAMIETALNGLEARALAKLSERTERKTAKGPSDRSHAHGRCRHGCCHNRHQAPAQSAQKAAPTVVESKAPAQSKEPAPVQTQPAPVQTAQTQSAQITTVAPTQTTAPAAQPTIQRQTIYSFSSTSNVEEKHGKRTVTIVGNLNGSEGQLIMKQKGHKKPSFESSLDQTSDLYKKLKAKAQELAK